MCFYIPYITHRKIAWLYQNPGDGLLVGWSVIWPYLDIQVSINLYGARAWQVATWYALAVHLILANRMFLKTHCPYIVPNLHVYSTGMFKLKLDLLLFLCTSCWEERNMCVSNSQKRFHCRSCFPLNTDIFIA